MIGRWIIKILAVIVLLGVIGFEVLSPVFIRFQIDGTAHDAADTAAIQYMQTKDSEKARQAADEIVAKEDGVHIDAFDIGDTGQVTVTVSKQAKSYLLYRIRRLRSWYDVKVKAASAAK